MKQRIAVIALLAVGILALAGCNQKETAPPVSAPAPPAPTGGAPTQAPTNPGEMPPPPPAPGG